MEFLLDNAQDVRLVFITLLETRDKLTLSEGGMDMVIFADITALIGKMRTQHPELAEFDL